MSEPRVIRAMVVGAGPAAAAMHLPVLAQLQTAGEIELVLVCDLDPERAAAAQRRFRFRERSGDAYAAMARDDIDAVLVFGSAQMHGEIGLAALRSGKHLFVEKPIATSYRQACELAAIARASSLVAVGGHNRRFYRSLEAVRARAGAAGWRYAEAIFHKPESGKPALFGAASWLSSNGIHALDALVFMMGGLPEWIAALAGEPSAGQPSAFSALMRWPDGAQATFLCNNNAGSRCEQYVFHAPGETWRVNDEQLIVEKNGVTHCTALRSLGDGVAAEHAEFLNAIRTGGDPRHAIATLAPSLFLAELIEAGFSGRVQLPMAEIPEAPRAPPREAASVLIVQPSGQLPAIAALLPAFRVVSMDDVTRSANERPEVIAAILARGAAPLSDEVLHKLPRLGIVGIVGLSFARYRPEALLARGIRLVNASEAHAIGVAEFALGLAILGRRRAFVSQQLMRSGGWGTSANRRGLKALAAKAARKCRPLLAAVRLDGLARRLWNSANRSNGSAPPVTEPRELRGALAGLIGWGANARAFATRLAESGARVIVWSERATPGDIESAGATRASLAEVLAADIVSLHRGLNPQTRHFLKAPELARLRPGALLINIARGALIEPRALYERLARGDVFACLDTFEEEPLPAAHPLRSLNNVFLTSHIAGGARDMREAATREVVRKVADYLEHGAGDSISAERLRTMS